jgi:competence protein ComEC
MTTLAKNTRFRAYQLGNAGSSFSYCDGTTFFLIEARLTEISKRSLIKELSLFSKKHIDTLHITSWDNDHCNPNELIHILNDFRPSRIEFPGYEPSTDDGKESLRLIKKYEEVLKGNNHTITLAKVTPEYITNLCDAEDGFGYSNILYHPKKLYENSNNNSLVMLFRCGSFSVLSLGDVEAPEIAEIIMNSKISKTQVDVMILAHHGADNGFTTDKFLKTIKPLMTVCSSNYDNQFEHPKQEIKDLLFQNNIRNFTTKTGDVIVKSTNQHKGDFCVVNLISDNEAFSSTYNYKSKRLGN